jgi:pimeloyl-ACP methyl ester carboxylesterase
MPAPEKSRVGRVLRQDDGLLVRESLLRLEPRVDLYVKEKWAEGPDSRLPVLFLHGGGMDGAGWDCPEENTSLADALARGGSRTFALDFRGHGRSSRVANGRDVTVETSIADAEAALDWALEVSGAPAAVLVGASYGSVIALAVAERHPERVAGMALLGLIYRTVNVSLDEILAAAGAEPCGYAFTTEEEWPELFIPTAAPAVMAWHQAQFGTAYAYPVGPYFEVASLPHCRHPERIRGRVLAITGDIDPIATVADTQELLNATSAVERRHLYQQGVGHMPYVEKDAAEVQSAIRALVDACTADASGAGG